ncbi:catalase [Microcoleus sp. Pol11C2]|uniref:catalase n=1 Tax=Microcoleus sp. Pol11C2 TaxID=3055389 RepID=UPI002FCEBB9E
MLTAVTVPLSHAKCCNSLHLAPSKIIPEELVPVVAIGKMVPNRNPDNCFAEAQERNFNPNNGSELKESADCGCF